MRSIHKLFNYISLFLILSVILEIVHCILVTKFPNQPEKEGRWWVNYLKTYRRNCWMPKGHIYMKMANLAIENANLVDELAFYLTTCILEEKGQPGLLCKSEEGEELEEISIRSCAKQNAFSWALFESFATKIPLMVLVENLEISDSDFRRMKTMMTGDDNLLQRRNSDPTVPVRPTFNSLRKQMQDYIDEKDKLSDIALFQNEMLNSVIRYVLEHLMDAYNEMHVIYA